ALMLVPRRGLWLDTGCLGVAWMPIFGLQNAWPCLGVELDAYALALSALGVLEGCWAMPRRWHPSLGVGYLSLRCGLGRLGVGLNT
ncbi:hypothetical protein PIB30_098705, partial [Stylosanthes scabra]|nr:hypothetical protein [Stylosanthes scabra]